jgi:lipoate-protein ligase A
LALPAEHPWASAIVGLYDRFLDVLEPALAALGSRAVRLGEPARAGRDRSPICFEDQLADTLAVDGRKAVGCSQTRRRGAVLIHAAILLGLDAGLYTHVFGVDEDRVLEGLAPAIEGIEPDRVADALIAGLSSRIGFDIEDRGGPKPGSEHLALYRQERWSPVPDGGMQ